MRTKLDVLLCVIVSACCEIGLAQSTTPAVFVTNNVGDSVSSFTVNIDGSLEFAGVFPSGEGPQTISLSDDGRFLAVGHGTISSTTEELRIFQVNSDASLTLRLTYLVPDSPLDVQWLSGAVLAVTETSLSGTNAVRTFAYDAVGNVLTPLDIESTGSFNTRLTAARGKSLLYANNTFGTDSIYAFTADASGQLNLIENEVTEPLFAVAIEATHDGNFLYGAGGISGGGNAVLGYSIDAAGALDVLPGSPFASPGASPKVIAFTGDDEVMVVGHGTDATMWSFLRDTTTGLVTPTSHVFDVGSQGTLADLRIMDDLLFVTDSSTAGDGATGIYSFRIGPDGSFTQLGPILDTQGARPEYIATWQGQQILLCDFDGDTDCDVDDLNALFAEGPIENGVPVTPGQNDQFDLNGDGTLDNVDRDLWLDDAALQNGLASAYKLGDANLNGVVDGQDFLLWNAAKFTSTLRWDNGNFNGDGTTDGLDFLLWNANKFTSSDVAAVPEPASPLSLLCVLLLGIIRPCPDEPQSSQSRGGPQLRASRCAALP